MPLIQTRRHFLTTLSMTGAAGLLPAPRVSAAESPLETAAVRLLKTPGICLAPQYLSEALLRAEGFTHVEYVEEPDYNAALPRRQVDFTMNYATNFVRSIDVGAPITLLAGFHAGC
jgi:NitT/TauT family transport system substrate-binding protein